MFAPLWPGLPVEDVPITHVTNGVHAETWIGPEFGALYRARLGAGYGARQTGWERLADASDSELFEARAGSIVDGQEAHQHPVAPRRGQLETGDLAQQLVGHLHEDPGAIAGAGIGAGGPTVLEILQSLDGAISILGHDDHDHPGNGRHGSPVVR